MNPNIGYAQDILKLPEWIEVNPPQKLDPSIDCLPDVTVIASHDTEQQSSE